AAGDFDDGALVVDGFLLRWMRFDIRLDLIAREAFRKQAAAGRHRLVANERLVVIEKIVAAAIDPEVTPRVAQLRIRSAGQAVVERDVRGVVLSPEDVLEIAAGRNHLVDHAPLA